MALFRVCIDESGKLAKNDFSALCGFLANDSQWRQFDDVWEECRARWQVPAIHMSRILRPATAPPRRNEEWEIIRDRLGARWERWRDALLSEFAQLVQNAGLIAVGAVIDLHEYRVHYANEPLLEKTDPNVFALNWLSMRSLDHVRRLDNDASLLFVIDHDPQHAAAFSNVVRQLTEHPFKEVFGHAGRCMQEVVFRDDKSTPGLQAADMLAYSAREYKVRRMKLPNAPASSLYTKLTCSLAYQPHFLDAEVLRAVMRKANESYNVSVPI